MDNKTRLLEHTPALVVGAALMLWGWQCQLFPYAVPMALLIELSPLVRWRWAITDKEFNTLSDFSGVVFFLVVVYIFSTEGARGIFVILKVLPFILFPLLITQRYSEIGVMKLSALIVSLRKLESMQSTRRDKRFDIALPYFVLCLVSASSGNHRTILFFVLVAVLIALLLWPMRSRRFSIQAWALGIVMAITMAYGVQLGMRYMQASIEASFMGMFDQFMWRYRDPNRATTAMGSLGRLKLSDRIVLRVSPGEDIELPILLKEASYSSFGHGIWSTSDKEFTVIDPNDSGNWDLYAEGSTRKRMQVSAYMIKEEGVIPLPHGSRAIENVAAIEIARNPHGTVLMDIREGWITYDVEYSEDELVEAPPGEDDLFLLDYYREDLQQVVEELGLEGMAPRDAVETLQRFFAENFSYTLNYRQRYPRGKYLANFLNKSRQGHCEYFATATALLLRTAGIPARYAVGYSVDEYSTLEGSYIARSRHAHSWTLVYLDGAWEVIDTTPAVWAPLESESASPLQPFMDLWAWISYRWELFQSEDITEEESSYNWLLLLLLPLSAFLGWRIYFRERVQLAREKVKAMGIHYKLGQESEFYELCRLLEQKYFPREKGETISTWLEKIGTRVPLSEINLVLKLHYRYRFDPRGIERDERRELQKNIEKLLAELEGLQRANA